MDIVLTSMLYKQFYVHIGPAWSLHKWMNEYILW